MSGIAIVARVLTTKQVQNAASAVTDSIAAVAGRLVLVEVAAFKSSDTTLGPIALTGGGVTWTLAQEVLDTQFGSRRRLALFWAVSPAAGALTATMTATTTQIDVIVTEYDGADRVVQSVQGQTTSPSATTLSLSLATMLAGSATYGAVKTVGSSGSTITPGAGFTELAQLAGGLTDAAEAMWAATGIPTVPWSALGGDGNLGIAAELGATLPP